MKAVIFDLDETLIDTAALLGARDSQAWDEVYRRIEEAVPFEMPTGRPPVLGLPEAARAQGLAVGLVTHAPNRYVDTLSKKFGLRFDAQITGSDGYAPKPAPASLLACAEMLEVEPEDCVYVGDAAADFEAAANAGMRSVGVAWDRGRREDWRHHWPDLALGRPSTVIDFFCGSGDLGLLAEMRAAGVEPRRAWGSIARIAPGTNAIGRYYPTKDRRHAGDPLTQLILAAKEDPAAQERLADCFLDVPLVIAREPPDIVASVPPDPEKEDRFGPVRTLLATEFGSLDDGGLLRQREGFLDYKMTGRERRAALVRGGFEVTRELSGESVLLLDDVITSGSQTAECRRVLKEAGAGPVTILVAGASQDALSDPCPWCGDEGGVKVTRTNHSSGQKFLACSNYHRADCRWTSPLP